MQGNVSGVFWAIAARILLLPARERSSVKTVSDSSRCRGTAADQPVAGLWSGSQETIPAAGPQGKRSAGKRQVPDGGGMRA